MANMEQVPEHRRMRLILLLNSGRFSYKGSKKSDCISG